MSYSKSTQGPKRNRTTHRKNQEVSKKKVSNLDPSLLVKNAAPLEDRPDFRSDRQITSLPIHPKLIKALKTKGFERPTEIQDRTLEALLEGRDLLGIAQTGTGKTGAFLVPVINRLLQQRRSSFALVIVPTRELATQVEEEFRSMTAGLGLYSQCFIGGTNINRDLQKLRRKSHVVIGTPGRLLDLNDRKALDFGAFHTLVLDEFDRMLDMGFIHDMKRILGHMEQRKHTMLFSATLDKSQSNMIRQILTHPVHVEVSTGKQSSDTIAQDIIRLKPGEDKFHILKDMLGRADFQKVLLFEETKHRVSRLCLKLNKAGIPTEQIHGNKSQNARQNALNAFKNGKVQVLVATDVASRGLDISDVSHVINYQVPQTHDSYIHRVGRTGRAGKTGKAYTFVA